MVDPDPETADRHIDALFSVELASRATYIYVLLEHKSWADARTAFQLLVWEALQQIPYGRTMSYGELARAIGRPTASRAVGAANGSNPLPIVVPCHRVIGSTGKLTGFGGGLDTKAALLALERNACGTEREQMAFTYRSFD